MSATRIARRIGGGSREAISLLKADHQKVKKLFDRFEKESEKSHAGPELKAIVDEAIGELKVHAAVEEELFYPVMRRVIEDDEGLMDEADEEHHAAKLLIAELELMTGHEEPYRAKFKVLAENVRLHIKEEEGRIFRRAAKTDVDFDELGRQMWERRQQLLKEGVPPDAEHEMVDKFGLRGDSPARRAMRSIQIPLGNGHRKGGRRHGRTTMLGALLLGIAAFGPARAQYDQRQGAGNSMQPGIGQQQGPGGVGAETQMTARLRQSILQGSPPTGGVSDLRIFEDPSGKVTILGSVHSQAEKDNITAKAAALVGFQKVDNQVIVR